MPTTIVDGNDVLAVRAAAETAVARARAGEGRPISSARRTASAGTWKRRTRFSQAASTAPRKRS